MGICAQALEVSSAALPPVARCTLPRSLHVRLAPPGSLAAARWAPRGPGRHGTFSLPWPWVCLGFWRCWKVSGALLSPGTVPRRRLLLSQAGLRCVFRIHSGFLWQQELKTTDGAARPSRNSSFHGLEARTRARAVGGAASPCRLWGPGQVLLPLPATVGSGPRACGHSGLCPILMCSANPSCSSSVVAEGPSGQHGGLISRCLF